MSVLHNIAASLPDFTDNPVQRLRHTVAAHAETDPADWAVTATAGGVFPPHQRTGLTYGDLAGLLAAVEELTGSEARESLARHLYITARGRDAESQAFAASIWDSEPSADLRHAWRCRADEALAAIAGKED